MFPQVMRKSHDARQRLLRLGIFKEVEVVIDISEGTTSMLDSVDHSVESVQFFWTELLHSPQSSYLALTFNITTYISSFTYS